MTNNNATTQMIQNIISGVTPPQKVNYADTAGSAKEAAVAEKAEDVTNTIKGKAITSIFESDGVTAKKATSTVDATNVTTKINNHTITSIFESDGVTVKKATDATNASNYAASGTIEQKFDSVDSLIAAKLDKIGEWVSGNNGSLKLNSFGTYELAWSSDASPNSKNGTAILSYLNNFDDTYSNESFSAYSGEKVAFRCSTTGVLTSVSWNGNDYVTNPEAIKIYYRKLWS